MSRALKINSKRSLDNDFADKYKESHVRNWYMVLKAINLRQKRDRIHFKYLLDNNFLTFCRCVLIFGNLNKKK